MEWGLIFAFWTFMALLMASSRLLDPRGGAPTADVVLLGVLRACASYYLWALLTPLIFRISSRYSPDRAHWLRLVAVHLGLALVFSIGIEIYEDFLRVFVFPQTGRRPFSFDPWRDILRMFFLRELIVYFAVLAAGFAREYFLRYRDRVEESNRLRAQLVEARLETLRIQLNPHFLFNTLHAVSSLVERDPKGVRRMIARLSALLRYTLEGSSAQEVTLRQEMEFLRDYLEIQQIRFQGRLEVVEQIDPDVEDAMLPSLILQPLVENAIKHGVSKVTGQGLIEIRARREGQHLLVSVRDNGPGGEAPIGGDGAEGGFGLRNTRERLEGLYGASQELRIEAGAGYRVTISLPYHTAADLRTTGVAALT